MEYYNKLNLTPIDDIHSCCKNSGKIYIKDTGEIDMEAYNKLNPKLLDDVCPCCGGTGKNNSH